MRTTAAPAKTASQIQTRITFSNKYVIIGLYVFLTLAYIGMVFLLPPDKRSLVKYQISPSAIRILSLIIFLPMILIWGLGFYAYFKYRKYANAIVDSHDGANHQRIADGLFLLALSLPINTITSNILTSYGRQHPEFLPRSVIIVNYLTIVIYLAAFWMVYKGANGLVRITNSELRNKTEVYLMMAYTAVFGLFFYLTLHSPAKRVPPSGGGTAAYYLPDWLIVVTILLPYAIMWYLGVMASFRLWLYRKNVKGAVYRYAFTRLAVGLGTVVASLMVIRYLSALMATLDKLTLKYLLLLIYILLIIIAVGYGLIAAGAKRLQKIEDV